MNKQAIENYQSLWNEFIEALPALIKNGAADLVRGYTRKLNSLFTDIFETTDKNPIQTVESTILKSPVSSDSVAATEDPVNHPLHYTWLKDLCGIEVIDVTRHMDFDLGNAIKYILRAGHKSEKGLTDRDKAIEDLKKAVFYINDKIKMLEHE